MIWKNPNRNRQASLSTRQTKPACHEPPCTPSGCAPAKAPGGLSRRNTGMGSIRKQRLRRNAPWMRSVPRRGRLLVPRGAAGKRWRERRRKGAGRHATQRRRHRRRRQKCLRWKQLHRRVLRRGPSGIRHPMPRIPTVRYSWGNATLRNAADCRSRVSRGKIGKSGLPGRKPQR